MEERKPNAFTVGSTKSYEKSFLTGQKVTKIGPNPADEPSYEGGCAFRTREEAQAFIDANQYAYSVYGLLLPSGWAEDVSSDPHPSDGLHRILRDVECVRLKDV